MNNETEIMDNVEVKTKRCSKCGQIKPISEFYKKKSSKDGLYSCCKQCHKSMKAQYYQSNKDAILKKIAEYYQAHKEAIQKYQAEYRDPQKNPRRWAKSIVSAYRQMDRQRGFDDSQTITAEWFLDNIAYKPCAHCGVQRIGLVGCNRLDNTKGHTIDNVEPCCLSCNCKENVRDQLERGLHMSCKGKARHKTA